MSARFPANRQLELTVRFTPDAAMPREGAFIVGRQQTRNDLDKVIETVLRKKVPKLAKTVACRRVLLLERNQFSFNPKLIFAEIERQRANCPLLDEIEEIWEAETVCFKQDGCVRFALRKDARIAATMQFAGGVLVSHSGPSGMPYPM